MTWLVKHSGELISKYQLNRDGQTAYFKVFGKACKNVIVEIGEEVHYRVSDVDTGSLDGRWESGTWLGIRWITWSTILGQPLESPRVTRLSGNPLKTGGAKKP
jgi:hypothetical protein